MEYRKNCPPRSDHQCSSARSASSSRTRLRLDYSGAILAEIDQAGFRFVAIKKQSITKREAEGFYAVHSGKPFFSGLTDFMSSGPLFLMVLERKMRLPICAS